MNDKLPLITLVVKSKDNDKVESLTDENKSLVKTLSMLCSFLSVGDFCSFIFSKKFSDLMECGLDLIFEIGIYTKHEVTLELTGIKDKFVVTDIDDKNYFTHSSISCSSFDELEIIINNWLENVLN